MICIASSGSPPCCTPRDYCDPGPVHQPVHLIIWREISIPAPAQLHVELICCILAMGEKPCQLCILLEAVPHRRI
jgi:hypothetical protein